LARPHGFWEDVKLDGPVPAPEPAPGSLQREVAVWGPSGSESRPTPADPSAPWLWDRLPRGGEDGGFADQRDACVVTRSQRPDVREESLASSPSPQGEGTCETQTQLRKFEAGLQTKKSSKKKMSETIFCLVSIPVKSESHLPATDTNNNDLKQSADKRPGPEKSAALPEQSLLSLSSTDLELQALTGGMTGRTELWEPDPGGPGGDQPTDGPRFPQPAKHRALAPRPLPGEMRGGSPDAALPPRCLDAFGVQMHVALASSDQSQRPGAPSPKGQGGPLSPTGQSQDPEPAGGARRLEAPRQEAAAGPAQRCDPAASADAFYSRRRCGWTESPLFVGEGASARQAPRASEPAGVDGAVPSKAPEPQPRPQECQPFHPKDVETKPPFRSTLFHFIERTPNLAAAEKRLRSTSKVIESLQEKLASPPRRADPDRLMRMKEVSSVSRLRLLTSRGADAAEEAEEPKAERGPGARPGGPGALSARHKLSDPRGALPLEEDGHPTAQREENGGQDFWC
ncbi:hypothetical protein E2I00_014670, partial [Balaenoptera physalus]